MNLKCLLPGIFLLSSLLLHAAGEKKTYSLKECIDMAVANSPRLKNSLLEQKKLQYHYKESVGAGLPNVGLSGTYDDYVSLPTQLIPGEFFSQPGTLIPVQFGTTYNFGVSLNASQLIYNQTYFTGLQLVKRMMERNTLETEQLKIDLIAEVARDYYLAQIASKQIRNNQSNLEKLDKLYEISQQQYNFGLIKKVDVDRIDVNRLNKRTEIDNLSTQYLQVLNMQKYFMGVDLSQEIEFTDSLDITTIPLDLQPDLSSHISIRLIEKDKQISTTDLDLKRSEFFPSLNLIGSVNYSNQSNTFYVGGKSTDWYNTSLFGLRLNVPVFDGFQKRQRVNQSKVQLDQIKVTEDDTRQFLTVQMTDAARKYMNSITTEQRQRENVTLAEKVYRISQEQYQKGLISLTDILNAESSLSDAQTAHSMALVNMKIAEIEYLRSTGKLENLSAKQQ
jgi:outer membrane protein